MWKTSAWERLWSVPCEGFHIFSHDGLQIATEDSDSKYHAHDARSGDALGEIDSMPNSIYDHVHMFQGEVGDKWECSACESSLLKDGEYWFTCSDKWLWVVEARVARRLIHIPEEYTYRGFKAHSSHVAGDHNRLLVLDTTRV